MMRLQLHKKYDSRENIKPVLFAALIALSCTKILEPVMKPNTCGNY